MIYNVRFNVCFLLQVLKTAQTHHFSIEKARNFLGYTPKYQNDLSTVITQYSATKSTIEHSSTSERSEVLPQEDNSCIAEVCTQIFVMISWVLFFLFVIIPWSPSFIWSLDRGPR